MDTHANETRDGTGAGDRDVAYAWNCPRSYLKTLDQARLLILRGYVMDTRRGEHGSAADGDLGYTEQTDSGLYVPVPTPPPVTLADAEGIDYGG
jgi:hypothetical protein